VKIEVNVTQEHIDKGEQAMCQLCPVALAIKDVNDVTYVKIGSSIFNVLFKGDYALRPNGKMPVEVGNRILDFDQGHGMQPFSFTLEVPDAA
jgi:hypothetical protein